MGAQILRDGDEFPSSETCMMFFSLFSGKALPFGGLIFIYKYLLYIQIPPFLSENGTELFPKGLL